MVKILLISHYMYAKCTKETISLIIGDKNHIYCLALDKNESIEEFTKKLKDTVARINEGDGVLIMADMFGGTPSNVSLSLFNNDEKIQIITGFNLPLVIEAVMHADKSIDELVELLMKKKDKTIINIKEALKKIGEK